MTDAKNILSQVPVLVTIVGVNDSSEVFYTFTDPKTGVEYVKSQSCSISAVEPYQTLFALDYPTTRNGWQILGNATQDPRTTLIPSLTPNESSGLLMLTFDRTTLNYDFGISFINLITGLKISDDPQEGNVLQPIKPGGATTG